MSRRERENPLLRGTAAAKFREGLKTKARDRRESAEELARGGLASVSKKRNDLTPELRLEVWRIADLKLPNCNVRKIPPAQVKRVTASIGHFGYSVPVIVDEAGVVLDGASRIEGLLQSGIDAIQCLQVGHLDASQKRLFRLAVNRLQEKGEWDIPQLKIEFEELIFEEAPLEVTGFDLAEIDHIVLDDDHDAVEAGPLAPDDSVESIAKLGDVYRLGEHIVICGDACDPEVWRRLPEAAGDAGGAHSGGPGPASVAGRALVADAALVLTDPPYNVRIAGNVTGDRRHREFAMASGEMTDDEFLAFNEKWMRRAVAHLRDGGLLASFIDWRSLRVVDAAARSLELDQLNLIVWTKTNAGMGSLYRSQHELLPLFKKGRAKHINNVGLGKKGGRWRSNVWTYAGASSMGSDARKGLQDHPTVKPTAMLEDALLDLTDRGDVVIDPFLGSGSTLIAAEKVGRKCLGIELDPRYLDVVISRWEKLTGKPAEIIGHAQ